MVLILLMSQPGATALTFALSGGWQDPAVLGCRILTGENLRVHFGRNLDLPKRHLARSRMLDGYTILTCVHSRCRDGYMSGNVSSDRKIGTRRLNFRH